MKIALLRIGADSGNLGFHSPLFEDGSFEYIPINETYNDNPKNQHQKIKEKSTYSNTRIITNKCLIDYFPSNKKLKFKNSNIHYDPEFKTNTYGDPSRNKNGLKKLAKGDYLIFYSSLIPHPSFDYNEVALYVIGYFEIDYVSCVINLNEYNEFLKDFKNNFHVKHWNIFERDVTTKKNLGLKLVKGTDASRLLKKAVRISELKPYGSDNRPRFVISRDMQNIFGNFGGKICIQRNALRIVHDTTYVKRAKDWLMGLE